MLKEVLQSEDERKKRKKTRSTQETKSSWTGFKEESQEKIN